MKQLGILAFLVVLFEASAVANPYLPQAWRAANKLRVATSAVTGGFVHFYSGLDYGIFEKYGLKCEHVYIRGQSPALAALANDQVQFNYGAADGSLPGLGRRRRCQVRRFAAGQAPLRHGRAQRNSPARRSQRQIHRRHPAGRLERAPVAAGREKIRPDHRRRDDSSDRRQPDRALSSHGRQRRSSDPRHTAAGRPR